MNEPIIDQLSRNVPKLSSAQDAISNISTGVTSSLANISDNVKSGLDEFSQQPANLAGATSDFFSSNSMLAKVSFIILVLIVFLFIIRVGVALIGYFTSPPENPFLVKGKINGSNNMIISQNPSNKDSATINRSNDAKTGLECTWSVWLYIDEPIQQSPIKQHSIFVKGSGSFDTNGTCSSASPGLYVFVDNTGNCHLNMEYNTVDNKSDETLTLKNVPMRKWVHIAIRLQNLIMDAYVNGTIANRTVMKNAPYQNFYDVQVCPNGGFTGELSNLRYYSHALTVFELNNIVIYGPNLTAATNTADANQSSGNYTFLSNNWYQNQN